MYSQQVSKIVEILQTAPSLSDVKRVYEGDFEPIPVFPAISVELTNRRRVIRGMGGIFDTECTFSIWVYVNKPNYQQALKDLEDLTNRVEMVFVNDKKLGGEVNHSSVGEEAEFGVANRDGVFLQTARLTLTTRKLGV